MNLPYLMSWSEINEGVAQDKVFARTWKWNRDQDSVYVIH